MLTLAIAVLFAAVFARALVGYVRGRDPVQLDITLIFLSPCVFCWTAVLRQATGHLLPVWLSALSTALLMAQPYLTLRLTARLRDVPKTLNRLLLWALVASIGAVVIAPRPLPLGYLLLAALTFTVTEIIAASYLLLGAQRRSGAARIRLNLAAIATYLFVLMMVMLLSGALLRPGGNSWLSVGARVVALISASCYLVAFVPPGWLRRMMSGAAWYEATDELQRLPATVDAAHVWRRYVDVVHEMTGTDAVVLIHVKHEDSGARLVEQVAGTCRSGSRLPCGPLTEWTEADLDGLLKHRQPIPLDAKAPPLAAWYAKLTGARVITAVPLDLSAQECGAVLLLDRHHSLFSADDLRLTGVLAGQARLLAERGAIIEEQRHLTAQLADSVEALTAASQAKSDFLAGMSHELRTPLNAIIGFSDLMRTEQPDGDLRTVPAEWIEHIHSSGRHLLELINDILDLAKVEAGRLELDQERLELDAAIGDVITGLRPLTDRKRFDVQVAVPPLAIRADPLRFRQILDNLLSNAIKFTPEGGRIAVSAAAEAREVAITVADSGIGIDPADHGRVFDQFQQVGSFAARRAGTGLGLALTRRLVEAHGGSILLESTLGAGSRFTVRLPAAGADAGRGADGLREWVDLAVATRTDQHVGRAGR